MRTFYIALIFVGCLSLAIAVDPVIIPARDAAKPCATAGTPVTGCTQCIANPDQATVGTTPVVCNATTAGYYIDGLQASACPRACNKCTGATACVDADCATLGFVPAATPTVACQKCKAGWTYDNGLASNDNNTNLQGVCISVKADSPNKCFTGFVWNSLPTSTRACVASGTGNCALGYSINGTTNSQAITVDCGTCQTGFSIVNSSSQNGNNDYYGTQNCIQQIPLVARPAPVPCKSATDTSATAIGCAVCGGANQCTTASPGYFIPAAKLRNLASEPNADALVQACQPQCLSCDNDKSCKSCNPATGYVATLDVTTGYCSCDTTKGYTSSVPFANVKIGVAISYNCVSQTAGQACSTGYVFGSAPIYPLQATIPTCLDPKDTKDCFTDPRTGLTTKSQYSVTSFWNQSPNPSRTCVPAFSGKCGAGYGTESNQTESATDKPLDGDCEDCIVGYIASGSEGNFICTKNASSILAMSIAFLGLLLALVF